MAGTVDEMLPDRGPSAAQQALRAASEVRVWDGRATAWLVVQRMVEVVGGAMILVTVVFGPAMVATCYLLAPVVRWAWSRRRPSVATPWPDGAQAYAVLAVLARVQWMRPDRLAR